MPMQSVLTTDIPRHYIDELSVKTFVYIMSLTAD